MCDELTAWRLPVDLRLHALQHRDYLLIASILGTLMLLARLIALR